MSDSFFRIEMLPAKQGDALWIEYGKADRTRRVLIDGGPINAYPELIRKLNSLPDGDHGVELLVISHVDTDHIEGIIRLFAEKRNRWPIEPKDIWFNGWRHMKETGELGGREGDFLSALINRRAFNEWNKAFNKNAIVIKEDMSPISLADGMKITVLAPNQSKLESMAKKWEKDVEKHGLMPGDLEKAWDQLVNTTKYHPEDGLLGGPEDFNKQLKKQLKVDPSTANGSSIAFLAEFDNKRCLFLADAHMDVICESIRKLIPNGEKRLKVDALKMSHHGSRANISDVLFNLVDAKHYLISTNGAIHNHPDQEAINAIIRWSVRDPVLWFNYQNTRTTSWKKATKNAERNVTPNYPEDGEKGIVVEL